jgi:guanylate kinase
VSALGRPFPVVISAPSGAGKTSLARALIERSDEIVFSVSATTRPARAYERQGRDYLFVSDDEFDRMIAAGELLEWATVHGRRYGTPKREIARALDAGRTVVLDIDVQGARQVRTAFPGAVLIFILPPTAAELGRRLAQRGSEATGQRNVRLTAARGEVGAAAEFDYIVVNDDFEAALASLESIVRSERHRVGRAAGLAGTLAGLERDIEALMEEATG